MTSVGAARGSIPDTEPAGPGRPDVAQGHGPVKALFIAASFAGSFLLFLVQPMVARFLLPVAGGSSALWNTAMVFFQTTLLVGYVSAHLGATRLGRGRHRLVQGVVFVAPVALALPIGVPDGWILPEGANVSLWALATLTLIVGLPFFALATASPTLQRWFADSAHPQAGDPYFLYAAGNVGSVLALVSYPTVFEPLLTLDGQARVWAAAYVGFVALTGAAALVAWRQRPAGGVAPASDGSGGEARPARSQRWAQWVGWAALAAIPSALLLGVTNHITTDLASFPLLWVVPLATYLLSYVLAFGRDPERLVRWAQWAMLIGLVPLGVAVVLGRLWLAGAIVVQILWFFAAAVLCHSRLAADRPPAARLTELYVAMSVGGALGGTLTVLVAPLVFDRVFEYPIAIGLALAAMPMVQRPLLGRWFPSPSRLVGLAAPVVSAAALLGAPDAYPGVLLVAILAVVASVGARAALGLAMAGLLVQPQAVITANTIHTARSPFGVYAVSNDDEGTLRSLVVGTTIHGTQHIASTDPGVAPEATTYYHRSGPAGQVFTTIDDRDSVALIGLGTGAMAAWGRPGDRYVFYEIDPEMVTIAQDPTLFTYLADTEAEVEIEVVDGRLGVARSEEVFDIVVVDAFSSDAVPVHVMTREAVAAYADRIGPEGLILFNVSNRYFSLDPVLGRIAHELGLAAVVRLHVPSAGEADGGAVASSWVVMSPSVSALAAATPGPDWESLGPDGPLWTDDYSNVIGALDL